MRVTEYQYVERNLLEMDSGIYVLNFPIMCYCVLEQFKGVTGYLPDASTPSSGPPTQNVASYLLP